MEIVKIRKCHRIKWTRRVQWTNRVPTKGIRFGFVVSPQSDHSSPCLTDAIVPFPNNVQPLVRRSPLYSDYSIISWPSLTPPPMQSRLEPLPGVFKNNESSTGSTRGDANIPRRDALGRADIRRSFRGKPIFSRDLLPVRHVSGPLRAGRRRNASAYLCAETIVWP